MYLPSSLPTDAPMDFPFVEREKKNLLTNVKNITVPSVTSERVDWQTCVCRTHTLEKWSQLEEG